MSSSVSLPISLALKLQPFLLVKSSGSHVAAEYLRCENSLADPPESSWAGERPSLGPWPWGRYSGETELTMAAGTGYSLTQWPPRSLTFRVMPLAMGLARRRNSASCGAMV